MVYRVHLGWALRVKIDQDVGLDLDGLLGSSSIEHEIKNGNLG
jgi:hypothetical protein